MKTQINIQHIPGILEFEGKELIKDKNEKKPLNPESKQQRSFIGGHKGVITLGNQNITGNASETLTAPQNRGEVSGRLKKKTFKKVTVSDFVILQQIGNGSFACVFHVRKKDTGEEFAMKRMNIQEMRQ